MARLILSAGMFSLLAAKIAVRRRGLESGSPPPFLAAMLISLISRVKILPRFASSAPFLCLIVAHFEWPDIADLGRRTWDFARIRAGFAPLNHCRQTRIIACRGQLSTLKPCSSPTEPASFDPSDTALPPE